MFLILWPLDIDLKQNENNSHTQLTRWMHQKKVKEYLLDSSLEVTVWSLLKKYNFYYIHDADTSNEIPRTYIGTHH